MTNHWHGNHWTPRFGPRAWAARSGNYPIRQFAITATRDWGEPPHTDKNPDVALPKGKEIEVREEADWVVFAPSTSSSEDEDGNIKHDIQRARAYRDRRLGMALDSLRLQDPPLRVKATCILESGIGTLVLLDSISSERSGEREPSVSPRCASLSLEVASLGG